jgi:hypothetical protein
MTTISIGCGWPVKSDRAAARPPRERPIGSFQFAARIGDLLIDIHGQSEISRCCVRANT